MADLDIEVDQARNICKNLSTYIKTASGLTCKEILCYFPRSASLNMLAFKAFAKWLFLHSCLLSANQNNFLRRLF